MIEFQFIQFMLNKKQTNEQYQNQNHRKVKMRRERERKKCIVFGEGDLFLFLVFSFWLHNIKVDKYKSFVMDLAISHNL